MTDTPWPTVRVLRHAPWTCVFARQNGKNRQPYLWQQTRKPHARNLLGSIQQTSARRRSLISSYPKPGTPSKTHRLAASAANASGFVQTPQSKVPRNHFPAPTLLSLPGHFRLSHSVKRVLYWPPPLQPRPGIPDPTPCGGVKRLFGYWIPNDHRVVARFALGGMRHKYRLERIAA